MAGPGPSSTAAAAIADGVIGDMVFAEVWFYLYTQQYIELIRWVRRTTRSSVSMLCLPVAVRPLAQPGCCAVGSGIPADSVRYSRPLCHLCNIPASTVTCN